MRRSILIPQRTDLLSFKPRSALLGGIHCDSRHTGMFRAIKPVGKPQELLGPGAQIDVGLEANRLAVAAAGLGLHRMFALISLTLSPKSWWSSCMIITGVSFFISRM
jgi:hypothetical protein